MTQPETSSDPAQPTAVQPLQYASAGMARPRTGAGRDSLRQGIICWGVYAFLAGIAYAALAMGGGDFVFLCIPLAVVMQLYALQGFIDGCRSLRSESRDWRGIAGLIVNLAALLPIPCALLAVIAFA
jgi:hypothetical protein